MIDTFLLHTPELALAAALAWGAGLRLYLVVFILGMAGYYGWWPLPEHLQPLSHPVVMAASGFMALVELFADKLPWLDSLWDLLHTLIRIPAGAALAAAVFGDAGTATTLAAALLGGSLTAATHLTKTGTRAVVNTSPEPLSNAALSLSEDALVVGGAWLAFEHPLIFLVALLMFLLVSALLLRMIVRGLRRMLDRWRGARPRGAAPLSPPARAGDRPAGPGR